MDAFSGCHQINVTAASSSKNAFAGPGGKKYRYTIMPFGLVNGLVISLVMMHDLKGHWDDLACEWEIGLGNSTNTIIIIDDTFLLSDDENTIVKYLEDILEISKRYNLSWKLEKCEFFNSTIRIRWH